MGKGTKAARAVSTETLLSGEMQTWRSRDHKGVTKQMGKQQEVTLWTGTERAPRIRSVVTAFPSTHANKHTLCDTNNS